MPFAAPDAGWAPIKSIICKIVARCNLNCDYCYVYHFGDETWRSQPSRMSTEVAANLGRRVREHGARHNLSHMEIVFHGGEPFLAGLRHIRALCDTIRRESVPVTISFNMQTNGVGFDERALEFCQEYDVKVGISIDGPREANDRHRLDHFGRSSFDAVERALLLLSSEAGRPHWGGILSVVDLANDPTEVYRYLRGFNPSSIEFLLPLANHDRPPPPGGGVSMTPYADWLNTVFDLWFEESPQTTIIRKFSDQIKLLAGRRGISEEWGLQPVDFCVVESNGDLELVDTLKTAFPGAASLNLNLAKHDLDNVLSSPQVQERQLGVNTLCHACQTCPLVSVCGGGYYPHRYSAARNFSNPSVYCEDLKATIRHIHHSVATALTIRAAVATS